MHGFGAIRRVPIWGRRLGLIGFICLLVGVVLAQVIPASASVMQSPDAQAEVYDRIITFAGLEWYVKDPLYQPTGPGPNYWSDSEESVWLDGDGLHLKLRHDAGQDRWYSAEVLTTIPAEYGLYCFQTIGRVDQLDPNVVLGLFFYRYDPDLIFPPEIDIEYSLFGNASATEYGHFTVQPWSTPGNQENFVINLTGTYSTHCIDWKNDTEAAFTSMHDHGLPPPAPAYLIHEWTYPAAPGPEDVPAESDEVHLRMNLWYFQGNPPGDGQDAEIVISDLLHTPFRPTLTASDLGGDTIHLAWVKRSGNVVSFEVQRSPDGSTGWTTIATPGANTTSYDDPGMSCGDAYYYRVRAKGPAALGDSDWSNVAGAYTCNPDTTGVFRPSNGWIYLKNQNTSGFADQFQIYGIASDLPVSGDWDGDNVDSIGVFRNGTFYLRNDPSACTENCFADTVIPFGTTGDWPVAGDWDSDGIDEVGVYRNGTFYLVKSDTDASDLYDPFGLGVPGDLPIAGDWDADGDDTVGVFRPSNGWIYLKFENTTGFADQFQIYGIANDWPLAGDWDADGVDSIGVMRGNWFYLRNDPGPCEVNCFADITFQLGIDGDMPIAGDWDGLP